MAFSLTALESQLAFTRIPNTVICFMCAWDNVSKKLIHVLKWAVIVSIMMNQHEDVKQPIIIQMVVHLTTTISLRHQSRLKLPHLHHLSNNGNSMSVKLIHLHVMDKLMVSILANGAMFSIDVIRVTNTNSYALNKPMETVSGGINIAHRSQRASLQLNVFFHAIRIEPALVQAES